MDIGRGLIAIAASIAVMVAFSTAGAQGQAVSKAIETVGKNPEAEGKIRNLLILGCGIMETGGIYGLLIALLLIFLF